MECVKCFYMEVTQNVGEGDKNPSSLERGYWLQHLLTDGNKRQVFQILRFDDSSRVAWIPNSRKIGCGHMGIGRPEL